MLRTRLAWPDNNHLKEKVVAMDSHTPRRAEAQETTSSSSITIAETPKKSSGAYCPKKSAKLKAEVFDKGQAIMKNPDLDTTMKAGALLVIQAIVEPMKGSGECSFQSLATIVKITGLSKPFVIKIIRMLDEKGYIPARFGSAGSGHSTHYRLNGSWDEDAVPDTAKGKPELPFVGREKVISIDLNSKEVRKKEKS
jgi:hypothetical protein